MKIDFKIHLDYYKDQIYFVQNNFTYRTRAINHRGFYSNITTFALKLPHEEHIKIVF